MKRIALLLTLVFTLSFGMAYGQTLNATLEECDGLFYGDGLGADDTIMLGSSLTYWFRLTNIGVLDTLGAEAKVKGAMNGYKLYSPDGATWSYRDTTITYVMGPETSPYGPNLGMLGLQWYDGVWSITPFSVTGSGADTLGFGGATGQLNFKGMTPGYDAVTYFINIDVAFVPADDGKHICIDSAFFPPSGVWMWAYGGSVQPVSSFAPNWNGPFCYVLYDVPNLPPVWTLNPATNSSAGHTAPLTTFYEAEDQDNPQDPISFSVVSCSGGGATVFNSTSGTSPGDCDFTYTPVFPTDVITDVTVVLDVSDGINAPVQTTTVLSFGNAAPTFDPGSCGQYLPVGKGLVGSIDMAATDPDGDAVTFAITNISPALPGGTIECDPLGSGHIVYTSDASDCIGNVNTVYTVTVEVCDAEPQCNSCTIQFECLFTEPWGIEIGGTTRGIIGPVVQGTHQMVPVTVNSGSELLRGFDLLIAYDATGLAFQTAIEGDVYTACTPGWEYFEYRYGPYGNCGNACPSGMLRVVGIAETNDGPNHPDFICLDGLAKPYTLFEMDFLVTNDRTFECMLIPISFFWYDCGDNSIAYNPVATPMEVVQGVSRYVISWDGVTHLEDPTTGFPTYTGVQGDPIAGTGCFENDPQKPTPIQFVDFFNGGIQIFCADDIDDRGDVNLNGVAYEIADAVLFSNYFIYGLNVFTVGALAPAGQVAATDVNADGLTLSVADLVYLIRVIVGDALPYPKLGAVAANYAITDGVLSVDSKMGAAYVTVQGQVHPELLADNMDMQYAYDGDNTRILVSRIEAGAAFEGDFLRVDGSVLSVEMATYEGTPVAAVALPTTVELYQNYPNPFNPTTTIAFGLPVASDYTVTIYNVTGQVVDVIEGNANAGTVTVGWDASNMASGIYFYKLDANNMTETRKMVLLK